MNKLQLQREHDKAEQGRLVFESRIKLAQNKQREDSTCYGVKLLAEVYKNTVPHIEFYIAKQGLTRRKSEIYKTVFKSAMENEQIVANAEKSGESINREIAKVVGFCLAKSLVEKCHANIDLTGLAYKLVKSLCMTWNIVIEDDKSIAVQTGAVQLCRMAIDCVSWLELGKAKQEGNSFMSVVVKVSEDKLEAIHTQVANFAKHSPVLEPMLCKPVKHVDLVSGKGGYLTHHSPLLKRPAKSDGKVHPKILAFKHGASEKATAFFDDINRKQEIGFRINKEMLELIPVLVSKGIVVDGLDGDLELMKSIERTAMQQEIADVNAERVESFGSEAFLIEGKRLTNMLKKAEFKAEQKYNVFTKVMDSAYELVGYAEFFFPVFLDDRAREYYYSCSINPQGNELHKCLLEFVECRRMTVESLQDTLVVLGNCLGYDKKSLSYRRQKAMEFIPTILEWDLDKILLGLDTETTLTGLAVCLDIKGFYDAESKGEEYYTHLPLHMDSCNSGSQINGLLLRDATNCRLSNIINVEGETLEDTYLEVALVLKKTMEDNNQSGVFTKFLSNDEVFNRKVFKKSSMTRTNYGAGYLTCSKDITKQLKTNHRSVWDSWTKADRKLFIKMSVEAIDASLPASNNYKKFAKQIIKDTLESNLFIAYNHPMTGFPVVLRDRVETTVDIDYREINTGAKKNYSFKTYTDETNVRGSISSGVPSITHSFDAGVLPVSRSYMTCPSVSIHDSIACLAGDVSEQLLPSLRNAYYDMATCNALADIRDQLESNEPVPYTNDFDIELIKQSEHFYS